MYYAPRPVQRIAFDEIAVAPLDWIEVAAELAVAPAPVRETVLRVNHVAPVPGVLSVLRRLLFALADRLAELPDTPVVVGVFERARDRSVPAVVVRDVAERIVVRDAPATGRALLRMLVVRAVDKPLPQRLGIGLPASAAEPRVRDDARGVVARHAVGKPGTRPLRKPSGLLPAVLEPLCHQRVHLGIGEVEKREKRAERIPESRPDIERSLEDAAGRGAPVHRLLRSRINVVVRARE